MITSEMIDEALDSIPFKSGDAVTVTHCTCQSLRKPHGSFAECPKGKRGTVVYVYYNGYVLIEFPHRAIKGGILNNDSTYKVSQVRKVL